MRHDLEFSYREQFYFTKEETKRKEKKRKINHFFKINEKSIQFDKGNVNF